MFTGIVECAAEVLAKTDTGLTLERPAIFDDLQIGASISVSGVCLSVVQFDDASMRFDVIPETWARTNLGDLAAGKRVNMERSLLATGRFEGHVVQGHIEGTAEVLSLKEDGKWVTLTLRAPKELLPYIVHKGAIALDGISLTVAGVQGDLVSIALIPHTLKVTTLGDRKPGERINVETDVFARYLAKMMDRVSEKKEH